MVTTMQLLSLVHARWVMRNVATLARRALHRATSAGRARGSTGSVTAARAGGSGCGELASALLTAAVVVEATVLLTSAGAASVAGAVGCGGCGEHARCTIANGATAQPARRAREIQTHGVMRSILTQETSAKLCSFSACSLAATASVVPCSLRPYAATLALHRAPPEPRRLTPCALTLAHHGIRVPAVCPAPEEFARRWRTWPSQPRDQPPHATHAAGLAGQCLYECLSPCDTSS